MDDGLRQAKSTGYTQPMSMVKENGSAPVESTDKKSESPVLKSVHTKAESLISTGVVSASKLLAIQVMIGDFKALKIELPASRQTSNGKIYWSAEIPDHTLSIVDGKLLVDDIPASILLEKLLEDG
jgi:hypothetical protein